MKNKANLILIAVTFYSALLVVWLVYVYVNTKVFNAQQEFEEKYEALVSQQELCDVVVCAADIPAGSVITQKDLLVLKVNKNNICDAEIISEPGLVINRKTQYKMYKGEWFVHERLQNIPAISLVMDKDKRAFRLWLDQTRGLIGLIEPGSTVDVLAVLPGGSRQQKIGRIFLQNIRVLAVANKTAQALTDVESRQGDSRNKEKQTKLPKAATVTLEVTAEQALQLTLAMDLGKLHLALRDPANREIIEPSALLTLDHLLLKTEDDSVKPSDDRPSGTEQNDSSDNNAGRIPDVTN